MLNGSRSPQARIRLRTPCRDKNIHNQCRDEPQRENNRAHRRWQPFGFAHLFPSLMPLSAVVPSLLTNRRRLLSEKTETQKLGLPKREKIPLMLDCSLESTFSIVDIFKVLALDNLFHDIISIHTSVVDPRGVVLHRVLLPPDDDKKPR